MPYLILFKRIKIKIIYNTDKTAIKLKFNFVVIHIYMAEISIKSQNISTKYHKDSLETEI